MGAKKAKYFFELLETPPIAPPDAPGVRIFLSSSDAAALAVGDPILYRGYDVGTVERSEFDMTKRNMRYQLFIRAPYDALVTENVRFWKASGMALDMSAEGVRIEMASMATLLGGGVTFDVLDGWPAGNKVADDVDFQLFENRKSIQDGLYNEYLEYLLFFDESIVVIVFSGTITFSFSCSKKKVNVPTKTTDAATANFFHKCFSF